MADLKRRHWAFVGYPESLPEDWIERLQATGIRFAVSPLHDKDVNPTGELKKAHYHVILSYTGGTRLSQVKNVTDALGQPSPIPLEAVEGYYRYLTHKDNPEKAQYSERDIRHVNGFQAPEVPMSKNEILIYKKKIQELCQELDITEYSVLMDVLAQDSDERMYEVAANNTIFCTAYLTSRRHLKRG